MKKRHLGLFVGVVLFSTGPARADADAELDYDKLSLELEQLLHTKIESASRTQEAVLDAPLSSTVITREQILRAGARTIMEALRLAPGLIVREQTSGNYDIHLRGFDNVPPDSFIHDFASSTILVMIDYRVVYNYYLGGTFWDALPVDLDDVDRIEIVRGPAAALYGPNAVTGVIHIITRRPARTGLTLRTSAEFDPASLDFYVRASAAFGTDAFSALLSANYSELARTQSAVYSTRLDGYVDDPADIQKTFSNGFLGDKIAAAQYPDLDLALRRIGANGFFEFNPSEKISLRLSGGYQTSRAQKILVDRQYAFLTTNDSETGYADLRAGLWGFTAHASLLAGHQATPVGSLVEVNGKPIESYAYDFLNIDASLDALWEWSPWTWVAFQLRPSLDYRFATYDGLLLAKRDLEGNPVDSKVAMQSVAGSFRAEARLFERLRLIGGVRLDYHPDRTEDNYYTRTSSTPITREGQSLVPAFQFAATYRFGEANLARAVYSRSSASPFVIPSYQNDSTQAMVTRRGNRAADLLTSDMVELGLRAVIGGNLSADLEIFYTTMRNFQQIYSHRAEAFMVYFQYDNLDDVAAELGLTLSLQAKLGPIDAQLFFTLQQTKVQNHAEDTLHFFDFGYDPHDPANQTTLTHRGTPDLYGGLVANYRPIEDLGLNLNLYYYTRHTMTRGDLTIGLLSDATYKPAVFDIRENLLVNLVATYRIWGGLQAFADLRNLFNVKQQEFPGGDRKRAVYMLGLKYDY